MYFIILGTLLMAAEHLFPDAIQIDGLGALSVVVLVFVLIDYVIGFLAHKLLQTESRFYAICNFILIPIVMILIKSSALGLMSRFLEGFTINNAGAIIGISAIHVTILFIGLLMQIFQQE